MTLPGFTAESAQSYDSSQYSENISFKSDSAERIIPAAPYWGEFKRESNRCIGAYKKYSAILWGVEWGESWEAACYNTPAWIRNQDGLVMMVYARSCTNVGINIWGTFLVCENSCGFACEWL